MSAASAAAAAAESDATAQAELVRSGQVSAVELVQAAIAAAERINPVINAIIHPRFEAALAEARAGVSGPFAGVPIVMKDLGGTQRGEPHHRGSRALRTIGHRAVSDSAVFRRLRDAGFVAIGRTNTPEWGSTITTEPLAYGPSRNPWNTDHSTGGSSGGSAAAVAARIVPVAHASDGGGSIRVPASECALVGLKPSRGRVSNAPDSGEDWAGYTTNGAVTRTVRDAAALLDVLAGYEPADPYVAPALPRPLADEVGRDPGCLRVGFVDHAPGTTAHPECAAAVATAARLLEGLGHHVEPSCPPALFDASANERFVAVVAAYTAADVRALERLLGRPVTGDDLEIDNRHLGHVGGQLSAVDHLEALQAQYGWCREVMSWWHPENDGAGFDLLVTPVIAVPPPKIGYLAGAQGAARIGEVMQFTSQFNVTGQPAISLPLHWTRDGLPVGVQIVAGYGREDQLIRVAAQLEGEQPWAGRRPGMCA